MDAFLLFLFSSGIGSAGGLARVFPLIYLFYSVILVSGVERKDDRTSGEPEDVFLPVFPFVLISIGDGI